MLCALANLQGKAQAVKEPLIGTSEDAAFKGYQSVIIHRYVGMRCPILCISYNALAPTACGGGTQLLADLGMQ